MPREAKIGIKIEGENNASPALDAAGKSSTQASGRFEGLKNAVKGMPDAAGKASAALMVLQNSTSQMGGRIADVANKVTALAALVATGGPLGLAMAAMTVLIMAASVAYETLTFEATQAKNAMEVLGRAMKAMEDRWMAQRERIKETAKALRDYGKTNQQVLIDDLRAAVAMREKVINQWDNELAAADRAFEAGKITEDQLARIYEAKADDLVIALKQQELDKVTLGQLEQMRKKQEAAAAAEKKGNAIKKRRLELLTEQLDLRQRLMAASIDFIKGELAAEEAAAQQLRQNEENKIALWLRDQQIKRDTADRTAELEIAGSNRAADAAIAAAATTSQSWLAAGKAISSSLVTHLFAVIEGTETVEDAMKGMASQVIQMAANAAIDAITAHAAQGAAGAGASVSSIPYVGAILAVSTAASVLTALLAYRGKVKAGSKPMQAGGINPYPYTDNQFVRTNKVERTLNQREAQEYERYKGGRRGGGEQPINVQAMLPVGATESRAHTDRYVDNTLIPSLRRAQSRGKLAFMGA